MPRSNSITLLVIALLGTTTTAAADISDGLIAWYPFDQGVVDRTGNIEPLEGESILPIITGKFGGALKLDGKSFITIPVDLNPDVNPSTTISLWVKTDPQPADAELARQLPNRAYVVSESIVLDNLKNDSTYFFGHSLRRSIVGPKHNARRGQWQHVALVRTIEDRPDRDGKTMPHVVSQFYSGGRMTELVTLYHGQDMGTDLYVGTNSPRHKQMFRGAVDELRIYDRALSEDEIKFLAKKISSQTSTSASNNENTGPPNNAGTTDTSALDNVNFGNLSAGDMAIDNPTTDNRAAAASAATVAAPGNASTSVMPQNSNLDDFQDRMDDPDFQDGLKAVDWNVKGMIPLTQEEKANIYPGSTVAVKIRVDKDDPANKIPDVKLALKGAQSRAESVPLRVMTSEQVPTARRDIPMTITIPQDFVFEREGEIGMYYADTWLLTADGMPLQDTVTDNNRRRLSIQVQRPPEVEDCGESTMNEGGTITTGNCLSLFFSEAPSTPGSKLPSRFKIDPAGRVHTAISGIRFIDSVSSQSLGDSNGVLQLVRIGERADKPCYISATGNQPGDKLLFDRCGGSVRESYQFETARGHGITAIKVCHRDRNNRVKGIETETRPIRDDGSLAEELVIGPKKKLVRCNEWQEFVRCPSGMAAAGIQASFRVDGKRSSLHGLGLICGNIVVESEEEA